MVRAKWQGTLGAALLWVGSAWGQQTMVSAPMHEAIPGGVITFREPGKPDQPCTILRTWQTSEGTNSYEIQNLTTGAVRTVTEPRYADPAVESGDQPETGILNRMSRFFHRGSQAPSPVVEYPTVTRSVPMSASKPAGHEKWMENTYVKLDPNQPGVTKMDLSAMTAQSVTMASQKELPQAVASQVDPLKDPSSFFPYKKDLKTGSEMVVMVEDVKKPRRRLLFASAGSGPPSQQSEAIVSSGPSTIAPDMGMAGGQSVLAAGNGPAGQVVYVPVAMPTMPEVRHAPQVPRAPQPVMPVRVAAPALPAGPAGNSNPDMVNAFSPPPPVVEQPPRPPQMTNAFVKPPSASMNQGMNPPQPYMPCPPGIPSYAGYAPNVMPPAPAQPDYMKALGLLRDSVFPSQREVAAETLATLDWHANPQVVTILTRTAREDPAATVRAACVRCLVRMRVHTTPVLATLQSLKLDADPRVRREASTALVALSAGSASAVTPASMVVPRKSN